MSKSEELQQLFLQHPTLKKRLQDLYEQTLEPSEYIAEQSGPAGKWDRGGRGTNRLQKRSDATPCGTHRWTQKGADKRVLRAIQDARLNPTSANDISLGEFANWVMEKAESEEPK